MVHYIGEGVGVGVTEGVGVFVGVNEGVGVGDAFIELANWFLLIENLSFF